jgi:hypothetical protein
MTFHRCIAWLLSAVAVVLCWLTVAPSASAVEPIDVSLTVTCDAPIHADSSTHQVSVRGAPASYDYAYRATAADRVANGVSARASQSTTRTIYDYDRETLLVQAESSVGTTSGQVPLLAGDLCRFSVGVLPQTQESGCYGRRGRTTPRSPRADVSTRRSATGSTHITPLIGFNPAV